MIDAFLNILADYSIGYFEMAMLILCGFLIGATKAGVQGVSNISIPIMALIFGAKASTGILLPILILADSGAIVYYRKSTDWSHLKKLLPAALFGVVLATWVGNAISDTAFKLLMASLILMSLILLLTWERYDKRGFTLPPRSTGVSLGISAGFTTMIGNMAGPLINIYLLIMKLPKKVFIATAAWFFYFINLFKVPFHIFFWKTINWQTLQIDLIAIPGIILGLITGVYLVRLMSEAFFRGLVIVTTFLTALLLFF